MKPRWRDAASRSVKQDMNGYYGYSPYGGGYGWINDSGSYTGYGYGSNPYSGWGWQNNQNPWR